MNSKTRIIAMIMAIIPLCGIAADDTLDAAIGGGVGGAIGAAVGNEVGGKDGAIVGGAIGGATGAAIATDGDDHEDHHRGDDPDQYHTVSHGHDKFCPPGQAKKGNC